MLFVQVVQCNCKLLSSRISPGTICAIAFGIASGKCTVIVVEIIVATIVGDFFLIQFSAQGAVLCTAFLTLTLPLQRLLVSYKGFSSSV